MVLNKEDDKTVFTFTPRYIRKLNILKVKRLTKELTYRGKLYEGFKHLCDKGYRVQVDVSIQNVEELGGLTNKVHRFDIVRLFS